MKKTVSAQLAHLNALKVAGDRTPCVHSAMISNDKYANIITKERHVVPVLPQDLHRVQGYHEFAHILH